MNARTQPYPARREKERVIRWNNITLNLASRMAGRLVIMDLEHELRALDQSRFTTDGIHFDSIEGQAWMNCVFLERLVELEINLIETGVLRSEDAPSVRALETSPGRATSSTELKRPGAWSDVMDRLGETPARRTVHPRQDWAH